MYSIAEYAKRKSGSPFPPPESLSSSGVRIGARGPPSRANGLFSSAEFGAVMNDELDLEHLLRKTLEFLLGKVGPTNAAIFLPGTGCGFTFSWCSTMGRKPERS